MEDTKPIQKMSFIKKSLVAILILVIVVVVMFVVVYKDKIFTQKTTITYPDGCKEVYMGKVLATKECRFGRFSLSWMNQTAITTTG